MSSESKALLSQELRLSMFQGQSHATRLTVSSRKARDDDPPLLRNTSSKIGNKKDCYLQPSHLLLLETSRLKMHRPNACLAVDCKLDNKNIVRLFQYLTTSLMPRLDLGSELVAQEQSFIRQWVRLALAPRTFHSMMWTAAAFLSHDTLSPTTNHESLRQKQLTIREVSDNIIQNGSNVSVATLWGMLALCTPEADVKFFHAILLNPEPTFAPVFPQLYNLHIHGRQPFVAEHLSALVDLIKVKGGLDTLGDRSLAAAIQNTDLFNSTLHLRHPRLPLSKIYLNVRLKYTRGNCFGHTRMEVFGHDSVAHSLLRAVSKLDLLSQLGLTEDIQELILDLQIWSRVLQFYNEQYTNSVTLEANLSAIAFCRNLLQYRVLELSTSVFDQSEDTDTSNAPGSEKDPPDTCRLIQVALLIFSVGVVFPITCTMTWERLIRELKTQLLVFTSYLSSLHNNVLIDCLVWSCFLGGLAAGQINDSRSEDWFLDVLFGIEMSIVEKSCTSSHYSLIVDQHHGGKQELTKSPRPWSAVKKSCLEPLLWCGGACDAAAQRLWDRVHWRFAVNSAMLELSADRTIYSVAAMSIETQQINTVTISN